MAYAFGVRLLYGEANVAAQAFLRDEARSEFSGVERDMHLWIFLVQKLEHAHLQGVIPHRRVSVFCHYEIDADDAGVRRNVFEAEKRRREDLLFGKTAQILIEEANLHPTRWALAV